MIADPGLMDDGPFVDFPALRSRRRAKVLDALGELGVDLLLLGREHNVRYLTGARRLWTSGTQPFAPSCVLSVATGEIRLMSQHRSGVPSEIADGDLFPLSWTPSTFLDAVESIAGTNRSPRVAVDGMSPMFEALLTPLLGAPEWIDAGPALLRARWSKDDDEIRCISSACAIAEAGLAMARHVLRPGKSGREVFRGFIREVCRLGVTTPGSEGPFAVLDSSGPRSGGDTVGVDDPVAMRGVIPYAGYFGVIGETVRAGNGAVDGWRRPHEAAIAACRPGSTGRDISAAYHASGGVDLAGLPVATSIGVGFEQVLDDAWRTSSETDPVLEPGVVLAIQSFDPRGPSWGASTVAVTDGEPVILNREPSPSRK